MNVKYIVSTNLTKKTKYFSPMPNKFHVFGSRECADNWIHWKIAEITDYLRRHGDYGTTLAMVAYGSRSVSWKEMDDSGVWQTPRIRYDVKEVEIELHY